MESDYSTDSEDGDPVDRLDGDAQFNEYFRQLHSWTHAMRSYNLPGSLQPFPSVAAPINRNRRRAFECKQASIWKRIMAEFIDGVFLFLIKFYMIIILHDGFDISFQYYINYLENPTMFISFTPEIAFMELISKIIILLYETYFLFSQGATPGKRLMGLKVYTVETIAVIPGRQTVSAWPCNSISWGRALLRSLLKNVSVFIFPIWYGYMISNFSRAGYDQVTHTFVVDQSDHPIRLMNENEQVPHPQ